MEQPAVSEPDPSGAQDTLAAQERTVDRLDETIRAIAALATDADGDAIRNALRELAGAGVLDEPTMFFLAKARTVSVALAMCLVSVLDAHAEALVLGDRCCKECQTPVPCRTLRCLADTIAIYRLGQIPSYQVSWAKASQGTARSHRGE